MFNDDLDFSDSILEVSGLPMQVSAPAHSAARRTVSAGVRKGAVPGAIAGGLLGGPLGAVAGGLVGHLMTPHPATAQISRVLTPQIARVRAALSHQALQRQATHEHRALKSRDQYQRTLMARIARIERVLADPRFARHI